jgi:hypothetical protein
MPRACDAVQGELAALGACGALDSVSARGGLAVWRVPVVRPRRMRSRTASSEGAPILSAMGVQTQMGADLLQRRKPDRFREVGFGNAFRIDRVRVAFAV